MVDTVPEEEFDKEDLKKEGFVIEEEEIAIGADPLLPIDDDIPLVDDPLAEEEDEESEDDDLTKYLFGDDYE